ncbi:MAG: UDP-N-acetylmuramoyl-L-alanine--D-glutamate ligase [Alphaproteobacteria bacterium]|nr:UDP-N-acetylmuramoyl-L-alanine--D-glutamate ligase [Alphaproteobacteria bacterium]
MKLDFAAGKTYGLFGLGKTGNATARAILAGGGDVYAWDDKQENTELLKAEIAAVNVAPPEAWPWEKIESLVLSPGVPLTHPVPHLVVELAEQHQRPIIGDIELLYRAQPHARYIAITGTNGKSTTTSLVGHIMKTAGKLVDVGGNLGRAVLNFDVSENYVLELSSYQLDLLETTRFGIAVLLNFSPDHLDRHGDMAGYIEAKRHIFDRQQPSDIAILGVDEPYSEAMCREMLAAQKQRVIPISTTQVLEKGVFVRDAVLHNRLGDAEVTADIAAIKSLQGEHNWQNAAAAYAACFVHGLSHEQIMSAMHSFPGLAHRMQWLGEVNGVQYVNDSKATNADATEKALKTYDKMHWIIGGVPKEGGIETLQHYFHKIKHAYLIGEAAEAFAATLGDTVPHTQCVTLERAFAAARANAQLGESVVLSPACASFDQFRNFEHRGEVFMKLFEELKDVA